MRYFEGYSKHNFVDVHNVFVGYDSLQGCCEHAGFHISKESDWDGQEGSLLTPEELEPYCFDTNYFRAIEAETLYEGGAVQFRLDSDGEEIFLTLFNCHNGYYGHGFEATIYGLAWESGCL